MSFTKLIRQFLTMTFGQNSLLYLTQLSQRNDVYLAANTGVEQPEVPTRLPTSRNLPLFAERYVSVRA